MNLTYLQLFLAVSLCLYAFFICYDTKVRSEEVYLLRVHKDEYDRYKKGVGRYLPRIRIIG